MSAEEERSGNVAHAFRNRLFWHWAGEMPRPLREGFLKTLHALGAGANRDGATTFRDRTPITLKQIARAAAVDTKDARRYLDAAVAAGVVEILGERKRGATPVHLLVIAAAPDWSAAAAHLAATKPKPKPGRQPVWEKEENGVHPTSSDSGSNGDAPASQEGDPEERKGDAPPSEKGGCTPPRKGDAPGTTQEYPSNYPRDARGDGRRPTTGSGGPGGSGSAAPADEHESEVRAAAIGCVIGLLPRRLRDQLPNPIPQDLVGAIRFELGGPITSGDLVARAERRWLAYGYDLDSDPIDGPGILRPVGVALTLIRARNCSSPRCNDGTDLDTGADCRTCEREAGDRRAAAGTPVQGAFLTSVPSGPGEDAAAPQEAAERSSRRKYPLENCDGCDRGHRPTTPGKLCATCRVEQRAVNSS